MVEIQISGTILLVHTKMMSIIEFKNFFDNYNKYNYNIHYINQFLIDHGEKSIKLKLGGLKFEDKLGLENINVKDIEKLHILQNNYSGSIRMILEQTIGGNDPKADMDIFNINNIQFVMKDEYTIDHILSSNGEVSIYLKFDKPEIINQYTYFIDENNNIFRDISEIKFH